MVTYQSNKIRTLGFSVDKIQLKENRIYLLGQGRTFSPCYHLTTLVLRADKHVVHKCLSQISAIDTIVKPRPAIHNMKSMLISITFVDSVGTSMPFGQTLNSKGISPIQIF